MSPSNGKELLRNGQALRLPWATTQCRRTQNRCHWPGNKLVAGASPITMKLGWTKTSGRWKRSSPTVMMSSGSSKVFSLWELSAVDFRSNRPRCSREDLHQNKETLREVTISHSEQEMVRGSARSSWKGNRVRHTVARVLHETRRASRSAQRQNRTDRHVHGGHDERRIGGLQALGSTLCPAFSYRPGPAVAILYTVHNSFLVLALICFFETTEEDQHIYRDWNQHIYRDGNHPSPMGDHLDMFQHIYRDWNQETDHLTQVARENGAIWNSCITEAETLVE